jgi:hypothetical protein
VILHGRESFVTSYTGFHCMPTSATNPSEMCLLLLGVTVTGKNYILLQEMWEVYFKEHTFMVEIQTG